MEAQMDFYQLLANKRKLIKLIRRIWKEELIVAFSF
jgi:hypothetical protein